jgi:hypothetical protein
MFDRVKAIVHRQFPITKGMCQMERSMANHARTSRIKNLMSELKELSAEQQLFILKQWEDEQQRPNS